MKITYNLQVLPQRKNSRKDSEETTALKAFLADSEKKNMVFEYDTPQEAKKRYDSMRNYRNIEVFIHREAPMSDVPLHKPVMLLGYAPFRRRQGREGLTPAHSTPPPQLRFIVSAPSQQ